MKTFQVRRLIVHNRHFLFETVNATRCYLTTIEKNSLTYRLKEFKLSFFRNQLILDDFKLERKFLIAYGSAIKIIRRYLIEFYLVDSDLVVDVDDLFLDQKRLDLDIKDFDRSKLRKEIDLKVFETSDFKTIIIDQKFKISENFNLIF